MNVVFCQLAPVAIRQAAISSEKDVPSLAFLLSRLLGNMGVETSTPILARFSSPVAANKPEQRWLTGLYLDQPEELDDPYRFFPLVRAIPSLIRRSAQFLKPFVQSGMLRQPASGRELRAAASSCDCSRCTIELCIWLTRLSERSNVAPISFIVNSS